MVTPGAADSHVATAEFLQVADREVEDFEGGLPISYLESDLPGGQLRYGLALRG